MSNTQTSLLGLPLPLVADLQFKVERLNRSASP